MLNASGNCTVIGRATKFLSRVRWQKLSADKQEEKEYNAEIEGKEIVEDDSDEEVSSDADSEDDETVKYTDEDVSTLIGK